MKKIKQIRKKKLIHDSSQILNKHELILLSFTYKIIIYFKILKYYKSNNKLHQLIENNFFSFIQQFNDNKVLKDYIEELIIYIDDYINNKVEINYYHFLFLGYVYFSENIPLNENISEWRNIKELENNFHKKAIVLELEKLFNFKFSLKIPKTFPVFRHPPFEDIYYDNTIIKFTCNHKINYIPTIKKVYNSIFSCYDNKNFNIIVVNPRFELYKIFNYLEDLI